jgi:bacteriorhodopsin
MVSSFEFWITIGVFLLGAAAVGFLSWLEKQPRKRLEPRLIPTTPLIILCAFIALLALVHLANLYGIKTGRR